MIFVSKSPELTVNIRREAARQGVDQYGQTDRTILREALACNFKPKALDGFQRLRADVRFKQMNPGHPYGAQPLRDGGVMGSQFAEELIHPSMPETYVGYDPIHQLGKFDTAVDINYEGQIDVNTATEADVRALVEAELMKPSNGFDSDYILLDAVIVAKPWPSYPSEGQGRHAKIAAVVREMGFDPREVIAYESAQEKPGVGVIAEMEKLVAEQAGVAAEENALSAVIT